MVTKINPGRPRTSDRNRQAQIEQAATDLFSSIGYEKTTIRLVAQAAKVDPKLVMHYFGNKQKLFVATMSLPSEVGSAISLLQTTPKSEWGERIAELIWQSQSEQVFKTLSGVIRASASEVDAAQMLKGFYQENVVKPIVASLKLDHSELRAVSLSSLMSGLVFTTEIVNLGDGLDIEAHTQKKLFAQLIQTALTTKL